MNFVVSCPECFSLKEARFTRLSPTESGILELQCPVGHRTLLVTQYLRYEILFEISLNAIIDGYYRESILNATGALERLFEHYMRIACIAKGFRDDDFQTLWKSLRKQSERQIGAFAAVFLVLEGKQAPILDQKAVEFRNRVVHQGHICSRLEAVDYCSQIADRMLPLIQVILDVYANPHFSIQYEENKRRREEALGNSNSMNPHSSTLFIRKAIEKRKEKLEVSEYLSQLSKYRKNMNMIPISNPSS